MNPIPIKQAMRELGYKVGPCRLPLCDLDSTNAEKLRSTLCDYGLLERGPQMGSITVHRARNTGAALARNI